MTIRQRLEQQEYLLLAPCAAHSAESAGRDRDESPCDLIFRGTGTGLFTANLSAV